MNDRTVFRLLSILPKSALSRAVGAATRLPVPRAAHQAAIRRFVESYQVEVDEAERPLGEYEQFADFFTRRLKPGARPIAGGEHVVVSPVDGIVAACGRANEGRLVQAKGREYSLAALLDDPLEARDFEGGSYVTLYLAPRDYHRIHAPLSGVVEGFGHIPGRLFPVNAPAVRCVPNLFCVNERLVTYLKTAAGRVAVVKVGATCVGKIRVFYDDVATRGAPAPARRRYERPISIAKGQELGVFEMGSTVVLLFEPGRVTLDADLASRSRVRMGESIGTVGAAASRGAR